MRENNSHLLRAVPDDPLKLRVLEEFLFQLQGALAALRVVEQLADPFAQGGRRYRLAQVIASATLGPLHPRFR
jgi:hypothetical protein